MKKEFLKQLLEGGGLKYLVVILESHTYRALY